MSQKISYEEVQKLASEVEAFQQQRNVFLQQFELMNHTIIELENSRAAIKEIQLRKHNETVLLPLGPQMLIEVGLVNTESVIFLLGSNISRKISFTEAGTKLVYRIEQAKKAVEHIQTQIYKLDELIAQREQFLQTIEPSQNQPQ